MVKFSFVYKDGSIKEAMIDMESDKYLFDISFNKDNKRFILYNKDLSNLVLKNCFNENSEIDRLEIFNEGTKIITIILDKLSYKISNISPTALPYEFMEADVVNVYSN